MRHFLLMLVFALAVAVVFGVTGRTSARTRFSYGLKVFCEFIGIGLLLGWLLYWLPL